MSTMPGDSTRASIVDVFENFFGSRMQVLSPSNVFSLGTQQTRDLVEAIDLFLEASAEEEFQPGTVCLESLANPIILEHDSEEPRTTRRAKQVALMHREVVIPIQPLWTHNARARSYVASLIRWARPNELLLRAHVLSLMRRQNVVAIAGQDRIRAVVDWAVDVVSTPECGEIYRMLLGAPGTGRLSDREAIEASIYTALTDAVNCGNAGTSLSFLHQDSWGLHDALLSIGPAFAPDGLALPRNVSLLANLELPAIADVSDDDFVAIRLQSEDFEEFRETLGRVLEKTETQIAHGQQLDDAFQGSLDEVRWKAEMLRRELSDKVLPRYLKKTAQLAAVGTIVSTSGAIAADVTNGIDLSSVAVGSRAATTLLVAALMSLLQYTSQKRPARLLRFYDVLLGRVAGLPTAASAP